MKRAQRSLTDSRSSSLCWFAAARLVAVEMGSERIAHVTGIHRCGSPHACPCCAPVVREARAREIDAGLAVHLERGGGCEFLTLTCEHHMGDQLEPRLATMAEALHSVLKGSGWDRRRRRLAYRGTIRAVEVTHGFNGWHPHVHVLVLFDRPLSGAERDDLERWVLGRWRTVIERKGFGEVSARHGVDLRPVTTAPDVANYLTKIEGGWSAGHEVARGDSKRKGQAPFALLREFVETGDVDLRDLWLEYEAATFGKRAIRWSPGLRAYLLGDEQEASDIELASAEGAGLTLLRALVADDVWNQAVRSGETGSLLNRIEQGASALLLLSETMGHVVQPLDVPQEGER